MCKYLSKGSQIGLKGRIQTRKYDDKNCNTHYVTEVIAEKVEFLESKKKEDNQIKGYDEEFAQQEKEMYQYAQEHPNNQYVQDYIQSDDLPF